MAALAPSTAFQFWVDSSPASLSTAQPPPRPSSLLLLLPQHGQAPLPLSLSLFILLSPVYPLFLYVSVSWHLFCLFPAVSCSRLSLFLAVSSLTLLHCLLLPPLNRRLCCLLPAKTKTEAAQIGRPTRRIYYTLHCRFLYPLIIALLLIMIPSVRA